jgi:hypothetical protein
MAVVIPTPNNDGSVVPETPKKSADETERAATGTPDVAVPMSSGTYAIYQTPQGGWHIAYLPSDTTDTQHFEIPAMAVQLFQAMQRGEMPSPFAMMKKLMSERPDLG